MGWIDNDTIVIYRKLTSIESNLLELEIVDLLEKIVSSFYLDSEIAYLGFQEKL